MRNDLIKKLRDLTHIEKYSEQDVLYFLVECSKFLEQIDKLTQFKVIKFYRNWVCHARLSNDAEKIFDEAYVIIRAKEYLNIEEESNGWNFGYHELVDKKANQCFLPYSYKKLKEEIEKFSIEYLDGDVLEWKLFMQQLSHIINDVPLVIKKDGMEMFRFELVEVDPRYPFGNLIIQTTFPGGSVSTSISNLFELD
jgi:hypothetical protein